LVEGSQWEVLPFLIRKIAALFLFVAAGCMSNAEERQAGPSAPSVSSARAEPSHTSAVYGLMHAQIPASAEDGQVLEYH
jgi:hypothetical protein